MTESLSTVATSGDYGDLTGTPTIPDSPDDIGAAPATHTHTSADIDSGAATDGHILTADGTGGAGWSPVLVPDICAIATDPDGAPLTDWRVRVVVNPATGEIEDIITEGA